MAISYRRMKLMLERMARGSERQIIKVHADTLVAIRNLLGDQYRQYEEEGKLTYEIMSKYERLSKLEENIVKVINTMSRNTRTEIHKQLRNQYRESYYMTAWKIESESRALLRYSAVKPQIIHQAVNNSYNGLTLNERLSRHRNDLIMNIREKITRGLHRGESYSQMTKAIQGELEHDVVKARRVVRTEAHRIREEANHESVAHAEEQGIIMSKQWNSLSDERVRDRHDELDGVRVGSDVEFVIDEYAALYPGGFGEPEMDINCRCFISYEIEEIKKVQSNEAVASMTYEEWKSERLAS
ncbi:phage minor head protein [Geomicrobium sediminis]|uniref:SPP1 gp7 family putative phage head morphogenesis protein n=1 Tax=Geomicrobium sediminis TaxID=1347788 RepID=A0ABS2PFJ8_9BACL|nr:phage minor head protein [Geomicrobium sediminis]MBM7634067.1 SPP1 gp7 family putative phage head morphogenesis protein [Geomicrobium sediminis]